MAPRIKFRNRAKKVNEYYRLSCYVHEKHLEELGHLLNSRRDLTMKEVLFSALNDYFYPESKNGLIEEIRGGHVRIKKELSKIRFSTEMLLEVFVVFVKTWMCHSPEVPKEHQAAAAALMQRRFAKFKELVLSELKGEDRLFDAIKNEFSGDDEPLMDEAANG